MSSRYSLRQTPRKKELFDGMIETPSRRISTRRKLTPVNDSDADADSSSAAETTASTRAQPRARSVRKRTAPKFIEHLDEDDMPTPKAAAPRPPPEEMASAPLPLAAQGLDKPEPEGHVGANGNGNGNGNGNVDKGDSKDDGHHHHDFPADKANGAASGAAKEHVVDGWKPGMDHRIDYSGRFEFGGTLGVSAMMIGFPLLMWYMWIGATYYDGKLPLRTARQTWGDFLGHLCNLVYTGAYPSLRAWAMYWAFFVFEAFCYLFMPGVCAYGKPLPHEGGKQLKYYCSGFVSLYVTLAAVAALHFTGVYRASRIIDEFGPLLTVSILSGYLVSLVAYFSALIRGAQHRMTGHPVYDFFMGAELNPRMFGILDFKMFFEVRLPWYILLLLSVSTAVRQYEQYGYVSGEVAFLVMAHYLYANACSKGEELICTTWDMYYEKWGFMLIFWNMAGVPLSYCHCTVYLASHAPDEYRWQPRWLLGALFAAYLFVYWVWDSCNGQKNSFRAMERGTFTRRRTFPQVPWQSLRHPRTIPTATGDSILVDGWYGLARKVHYTCDAFFAVSWGLITGFRSPFPWFYPVFFCCMIAHRAYRDIQRCRLKYGDAWKEYERRVPYLFIPYVI